MEHGERSEVRAVMAFYGVLKDLIGKEEDEMAQTLVRRGKRLYRQKGGELRSAASKVGEKYPDDFDSFQTAMDTVEVAFETRKAAEK